MKLRLTVVQPVAKNGPVICSRSRAWRIGTASSCGMATNTVKRAKEQHSQHEVQRLCKEGQLVAALAAFKNKADTLGALTLVDACQHYHKRSNGGQLKPKDLLDVAFEVHKHWTGTEEASLLRSQLRAHASVRDQYSNHSNTATITTAAATTTTTPSVAGVNRAQRVFSGLIDMCLHYKQPHRALHLLDEMEQQWSLPLGRSSFCHLLRACASSGDAATAKKLLTKVSAMGNLGDDRQVMFRLTVIDCTQLVLAFERAPQGIRLEEVRSVLNVMCQQGIQPDILLGNKLITIFGKLKHLDDARQVFDRMTQRDLVSWNAMIAAHVQLGKGNEALDLFERMQRKGMKPDTVTFISALGACASATALAKGKQIHAQVINSGVKSNMVLETALVNMYSKCGSLTDARQVFDKMSKRSVISWSAIIAAHAQHGEGKEALDLFERMQQEGIKPDNVTFVSVLSACSHSGLVDEGLRCFELMQVEHKIVPTLEHYGCMVDLLGRAGQLDNAEKMITTAPVAPDVVTWMTLLGACRLYGDVERAERVAARIFDLEPQNAAVYVLLGNIYAAAGRWADEARIRERMKELRIQKEPGQSWIEIDGQVHTFLMDDRSHPERRSIDAAMGEVSERIAAIGYKPDTSWVLHDVDEQRKRGLLCQHSEKLATVYGLIRTPPGTPLVIVKNLRMCGDCHNATKHIAKAYGREIKVRDANRYHHFSKDGTCSCHDYF